MNRNFKYLLFIMLSVFLVYQLFQYNEHNTRREVDALTFSEFMQMLDLRGQTRVGKIFTRSGYKPNFLEENPFVLRISPRLIEGRYIKPGVIVEPTDDFDKLKAKSRAFTVELQPQAISDKLLDRLEEHGVLYKFVNPDEGIWASIMQIMPILFIVGLGFFWFFMMRQIQNTGSRAMAFGKSKAKLSSDSKKKVTFSDVAGCDEAKAELVEVVDFLKDPKKFQAIGARIPTGVLLVGPPGTGKTLLARAIAGEAGVPFFSISGSDFVEMFVGVGASRVRDLFEQAKKNAPCIIFIDEIDAVGRLRGAGLGGGHDEREQTLNQMLVEMDGFEENEGIIIVAATNRPDVLDPALLRPGRFDRQVVVDIPDLRGREQILAIHTRKVPMTSDVSLSAIARGTPGFTGADLENLVNEAALLTARRNKRRVTMEELEEAKDKVMMGPERRSFIMSQSEKEVIAYHEAGHALLGMLCPYAEPVHKVTIIPRGRALGLTWSLPTDDKHIHPKKYWDDRICVLMGGYIAEELVYNDTATGTANDIQVATNIARRMVCEWGMSEKLGTISYSSSNDTVFLGREIQSSRHHSDETASLIDLEVKRIVQDQLNRGRRLITENRPKLDMIAKALLDRETINADEIDAIIGPLAQSKRKTEPREDTGGAVNPDPQPAPA